MTMKDSERLCKEYADWYVNQLSNRAQDRLEELDTYAAGMGLKFEMTNWSSYAMPHTFVKPKFILTAI